MERSRPLHPLPTEADLTPLVLPHEDDISTITAKKYQGILPELDITKVQSITFTDVDGTLVDDRAPQKGGIGETSTVLYNKLVRERLITDAQLMSAKNIYPKVTPITHLEELREEFDHLDGPERRKFLDPLVANLDAAISSLGRKTLNAVARELVHEEIIPNMYKEPLEVLSRERENGALIALVSGAPQPVITALGRALGADYAVGTHYRKHQGDYSRLHPSIPRSRNKEIYALNIRHRASMRYFDNKPYPLWISAALGDTEHDTGLFVHAEERYVIGEKPCVQQKLGELGLSYCHIIPSRHSE